MHQKILSLTKNNSFLIAFLFLGVISYFATSSSEENKKVPALLPEVKSVDTFVPKGYVLTPLEIANAESLSSLIGDMGGVVDLYLAATETQKGGIKVGSKIKLFRMPQDPMRYSALLKDPEGPSTLLKYSGPFVAVVQNPDEKGSQLSSNQTTSRIRVEYQN